MKKLLIAACLCFPALCCFAGNNLYYSKGYRASISAGWPPTDGERVELTTAHGYSFGNGLFVGGGLGVDYGFYCVNGKNHSVFIPIFANIKYSFLNRTVSPFVDLRGGALIDYSSSGAGYSVMPSIGADVWRFSVGAGYEMQSLAYMEEYRLVSDPAADNSQISAAGLKQVQRGSFLVKIYIAFRF